MQIRRSKTKKIPFSLFFSLFLSFSASRRRGGGRRREENARKFFGFCTRESASVSDLNMEIQIIKDWENQNQGFLAIILFLVLLFVGWISGFFKLDKKNPEISAGGDVKAGGYISVGNKTFIREIFKSFCCRQRRCHTISRRS